MSYYHNYYDASFKWPDGALVPDLTHTRTTYSHLGIRSNEADALIRSGFVMLEKDVIIDRFYGGRLISADNRTRIHVDQFAEWYQNGKAGRTEHPSAKRIFTASSLAELESHIFTLQEQSRCTFLFRGQARHHQLIREIQNYSMSVGELGEVSLLPSLWRRMRLTNKESFHSFSGLSLLEWSKIIYSQFDIKDIDRRVDLVNASGGWMNSAQDMEDSEDPVLHEFGCTCLDLTMGQNHNLADLLNTLLQHYGLLSPYLDLTTDLRIALYFAAHQYEPDKHKQKYRYVGTNEGESVLYVFRRDQTEMQEYTPNRVLHGLKPLRPERQSCVICRSSPYALNLAADFLVAVIKIEFELSPADRLTTSDLFPSPEDDNFLRTMKKESLHLDKVTEF